MEGPLSSILGSPTTAPAWRSPGAAPCRADGASHGPTVPSQGLKPHRHDRNSNLCSFLPVRPSQVFPVPSHLPHPAALLAQPSYPTVFSLLHPLIPDTSPHPSLTSSCGPGASLAAQARFGWGSVPQCPSRTAGRAESAALAFPFPPRHPKPSEQFPPPSVPTLQALGDSDLPPARVIDQPSWTDLVHLICLLNPILHPPQHLPRASLSWLYLLGTAAPPAVPRDPGGNAAASTVPGSPGVRGLALQGARVPTGAWGHPLLSPLLAGASLPTLLQRPDLECGGWSSVTSSEPSFLPCRDGR